MARPELACLRVLKMPVSDLPAALEWYQRLFGFEVTLEFPDADGVVRGVAGSRTVSRFGPAAPWTGTPEQA